MKQMILTVLLAGLSAAQAETNALVEAAAVYNRGLNLLASRDWPQAIESFTNAAAIRPDFFEARRQTALAYVQWANETAEPGRRLARLQSAAEFFSQAAALRPDDKPTRMEWSATLEQIGDLPVEPATRLACYQGALEQCKRAAAIAPEDWDAYNRGGTILATRLSLFTTNDAVRSQLYREAAEQFRKAAARAKFSSDLATAHLNWGAALVEAARYESDRETKLRLLDQALDNFSRAARAQPQGAAVFAAWGSALVDQWRLTRQRNDLREAIDKFQSALAIHPRDPAMLYRLATAYALLDSRLTAVQQLRDCFDNDPNHYYRRQAVHDPDLDNLRADPVFQSLVLGDQPARRDGPPRLRDR